MSCFFGGANEIFFTWQVSSLSQETFCITFTHYTSFSRHAEPGSLFSGAEIDVHVIRHNLLQKAILIFGLDSVGMDISVSRSVAVVWSRLKTQTIECLAMKFGTDIHFCTVVVSMSLSGHFCVSLYCSVSLVFLCLSSSLLSLHHLHHPLGSFACPLHLSFLRLFPPASSQ